MDLSQPSHEFTKPKNSTYVSLDEKEFVDELIRQGYAKDTGFRKRLYREMCSLIEFDAEYLRSADKEKYEQYSKDYDEYYEANKDDIDNAPINFVEEVQRIVDVEYYDLEEELIDLPPREILSRNYELHVKTELWDTLVSVELEEEYAQALYTDKDNGILNELYEDFLGREYSSVNNGSDVMDFIIAYCEDYHKDIIEGIQNQPKDENVVYLGERRNTAYYYFKDKLGYEYDEPRIKKEADEYIIAAPVCYLSQTYLEEHNITFLRVGRDIDESVLNPEMEIKARREMDKAYNRKLPLEATRISADCKRDIEQYIRSHFNGMRLDMEYFDDLIEHYGLKRMIYVLANTVQLNETDGRYSPQNKEWAKAVVINNEEKDRRLFNVESHPAIVDGVITAFRKIEKENVDYTRIEIDNGYGKKVTIRPDITLPFFKDMVKGNSYGLGIRLFAVTQADGKEILEPYAELTKSFDEFIGIKNAAYVDTNNCPFAKQFLEKGIAKDTGFTHQSGRWEYPLWVFDEKFLRQSGEEAYEKYAKQYEENEEIKEGQEMPQEKREWVTVKVSQNAVLSPLNNKQFDKTSL